ncbi:MAG: hypothetical protein IKM08_08235 [Clostridia bacterium]|nr:hypothetical protein [Clostridia bacterium]
MKIPDVTFKNYIGIAEIEETPVVPDVPDEPTVPDTYPVTDTLKGLYYLGGTAADSVVDHSGNGNNATVKGTITYADGYATFTGTGTTNRMDTPVLTSYENNTTIVALFRVPTGNRSIVSTFDTNQGGFVFANSRAHINAAIDGVGSGVNKVFAHTVGADNFALCAISVNNDVCRVVKDANGTIEELLNYTGENICNWQNAVTIGGYRANVSWNDTADIALVSIHEGDVTDEQLQQIFAYVRWYGESKGLTIE